MLLPQASFNRSAGSDFDLILVPEDDEEREQQNEKDLKTLADCGVESGTMYEPFEPPVA